MSNFHYDALLTCDQLYVLRQWLARTGELYVRLEFPRRGGSGITYLVKRLAGLKQLLARQTHPELELFIYRDLQFPLRGVADQPMLQRAFDLIPDGTWYSVVSLETYYPKALDYLATGSSHRELETEFPTLFGRRVGVGVDPCDVDDLSQVHGRPDVLFVGVRRNYAWWAAELPSYSEAEAELARKEWNEADET